MRRALAIIAAIVAPLAAAAADAAAPAAAPAMQPRFMYNLAEMTGEVASSGAPLYYDRAHRELYAVVKDSVRVFNQFGMEEFRFPLARAFAGPVAIVALGNGDVLTVSGGWSPIVGRYDFQGQPVGPFVVSGAPAGALDGFRPDAVACADGRVYLVDRAALKVVVSDEAGAFQKLHELRKAGLETATRNDAMGGFDVDGRGNLLFTMPTMWQAYVVAPDGKVRAFGSRGSSPGRFNIIGPIAADESGRVLVLDVLRAGVMVFDAELNFVVEFGGRGFEAGGLIAPTEMAVGSGKVFVSQQADRGVSVFRYSDGVSAGAQNELSQSKHAGQQGEKS